MPVLESEWPTRLASLARLGPVVALLGFADRSTVTLARRQGAAAHDLRAALERMGLGFWQWHQHERGSVGSWHA